MLGSQFKYSRNVHDKLFGSLIHFLLSLPLLVLHLAWGGWMRWYSGHGERHTRCLLHLVTGHTTDDGVIAYQTLCRAITVSSVACAASVPRQTGFSTGGADFCLTFSMFPCCCCWLTKCAGSIAIRPEIDVSLSKEWVRDVLLRQWWPWGTEIDLEAVSTRGSVAHRWIWSTCWWKTWPLQGNCCTETCWNSWTVSLLYQFFLDRVLHGSPAISMSQWNISKPKNNARSHRIWWTWGPPVGPPSYTYQYGCGCIYSCLHNSRHETFHFEKKKCLMNTISLSILHRMIWIYFFHTPSKIG